jgi:hypothetical protein
MQYEPTPNATDTATKNELNLNDADDQQNLNLIPEGTIAKVRMTIKPGGYNEPSRGWAGGYATRKPDTGAIYLNCEFTILEGTHAKRKVWSLIGLHSEKGSEWNRIGRSFMKAIINSAYGLDPKDTSAEAIAKRDTNFFALNRIEFIARIDVEKDKEKGEERNVIKRAVTKGHKDYPGTRVPGEPQAVNSAVLPLASVPSWAR